jgi:hypothetical protein
MPLAWAMASTATDDTRGGMIHSVLIGDTVDFLGGIDTTLHVWL